MLWSTLPTSSAARRRAGSTRWCSTLLWWYRGGMRLVSILVFGLVLGCDKENSVELGGDCKEVTDCKAPADNCVAVTKGPQCTKLCTKKAECPDAFVCARVDMTQSTPEANKQLGVERGYCLPEAQVPPRAAKLR